MNGKQRQRVRTRNAIPDALADVIAESGGLDFSVQQVADRAGVTHPGPARRGRGRFDLRAQSGGARGASPSLISRAGWVCHTGRRIDLRHLSALGGATDEELTKALHVSLPTVKKTWLSIYGRAAALPQLMVDKSPSESRTNRGKEKRRHLLAYLREHPEELRPYSLKLLP